MSGACLHRNVGTIIFREWYLCLGCHAHLQGLDAEAIFQREQLAEQMKERDRKQTKQENE